MIVTMKQLNFAARLQQLLDEQEMSGYALAEKSGISRPAIYRFLDGSREPSLNALLAIAAALNVDIGVFNDLKPVLRPARPGKDKGRKG